MKKSFSIAGIEIPSDLCLAPLAGYSDASMRKISYDYGARLLYTEMESCESLVYHSKATLEDLHTTAFDRKECPEAKLALQIFGGKADIVLQSIPLFEQEADYDFLDFNCGCPVPKVVELLEQMVKISKKPVIVKIRIGYSDYDGILDLVKRIEEVGVSAIAVHGRTRNEFFQGPVHYDVIRAIKETVSIPVIANGEISQENFLEVQKETGADAYMIGQHAIGYPKVFDDILRLEQGEEIRPTTIEGQLNDLEKHLSLIYQVKDERSASSILRSLSVRYIKSFPNSKTYRNQLVHSESKEEYLTILRKMREEISENI